MLNGGGSVLCRSPVLSGLLTGLAAIFLFGVTVQPVAAQPQMGEWIVVRTPITSESVTRIKNETSRAIESRGARILVYHFQYQNVSEYGPCSDLAQFILQEVKGRAETYAYVDKPLKGHATLPSLACRFLWMGPEGAVGEVNHRQKEPIGRSEQVKYLEVAEARGKPGALILKMLYPDLVVYQVDSPHGVSYKLDRDQIAKYGIDPKYALTPDEVNRQPTTLLPEGENGLFGPYDKRTLRFGLWGQVYNSPQKVAEALGLPGSVIVANPLLDVDQPPRAGWIKVEGELNRRVIETTRRQITRAIERDKVNCLILQLDTFGKLNVVEPADELAKLIQSYNGKVLTVAYVPNSCKGAATFIALACSRIVMGPKAELGDCQALIYNERGKALDEADVKPVRERLVSLAQTQGYHPVLIEGLVNPSLEIVKVQAKPDPNVAVLPPPTFMTKAEAERQRERWNVVQTIKKPNEPFAFPTEQALAWGVAWNKVENAAPNVETVAKLEGIDPRNVIEVRNDFLDGVVSFLTLPATTIFLVIVAFTCLILEFKAPGVGLPAILAATCFVLVFWSHSWLAGEPNSLAIILFLLGVLLLAIELFLLPGFGGTGISGIVLMLLSLSLVMLHRWPQSEAEYRELGVNASLFAGGLIVALFAAYGLARFLPSIPYANRLVLQPPDEETSDAGQPLPLAQPAELLGAMGVAVTTLRPAGKARFDDNFVDVVAEGSFVDVGSRVQVVEIDGVRVIVKPV